MLCEDIIALARYIIPCAEERRPLHLDQRSLSSNHVPELCHIALAIILFFLCPSAWVSYGQAV